MQRKVVHHVIVLFLLSTFLSPLLIRAYHDVFEHTHEKKHKHNTLSYCDDSIDYCAYSNLAYYPLQYIDLLNVIELYIDSFFDKKSFCNTLIYASKVINSSKGRSPPAGSYYY